MDRVKLDYSTKNIPIHNRSEYRMSLIQKTRIFIRNLRWKTHFYLKPPKKSNQQNYYGFKSEKNAPPVPEIKKFEEDLIKLVENVKFKKSFNVSNDFQKQLSKDIEKIKENPNIIVKGDKSSNFYNVKKEKYSEVLHNTVTSVYKKAPANKENKVTEIDKKLAQKLNIEDRVEIMPKSESYFTYKDHKPNFENRQTVRLINPNKSNLQKVSKQVIQRINENVRPQVNFNQWRNTKEVLEWFKNLENKERTSFIKFDIDNFYPSITSELLDKSLTWAETYVYISPEDKEIIKSTKQSILYKEGQAWVKKTDIDCDITIGSWDGAEVSELVGLYLLSQLQNLNINVGLYRDDGLGASTQRPQQIENVKKKICQVFRENGLKITVEANKKVVDYLDVTLDLNTNSHKPYMKPNSPLL